MPVFPANMAEIQPSQEVHSWCAYLVGVRARAGDGLDGVEDGREDVGGVVGHLVLQHARHALHAHPRVHVLRRQRPQARVSLPVVLRGRTQITQQLFGMPVSTQTMRTHTKICYGMCPSLPDEVQVHRVGLTHKHPCQVALNTSVEGQPSLLYCEAMQPGLSDSHIKESLMAA